MSSGVQFYLDLITGSFDSKLNKSKGELKAFSEQAGKIGDHLDFKALLAPIAEVTAALTTIGGIMAGINGAVELGDEMVNLSNRTGIAVENLMMMRRLFKDSGVEAEKIGPAVNKMQKYLSESASTKGGSPVLRQLNLDPKAEASKAPAEAFRDIGTAIAGIGNQSDRARAAIAIFGKSGGELLQVFQNPDFKNMGDLSNTAKLMGENAYLFKEAHDQLEHIGGKLSGLFIGMAGPIMAAIEPLLELGNSIDLSGIGEEIGSFFENFSTDFDEQMRQVFEGLAQGVMNLIGELPLLISGLVGVVAGLIERLGVLLIHMFKTPLDYFQAGLQAAIEQVMQGMGKIPGLNKLTGTEGYKANSFDDILKQTQAEGNGAEQLAQAGKGDANALISEGLGQVGEYLKSALVDPMKGAFTATDASKEQLAKAREESSKKFKHLGGEDEEAMGFGKGSNSFADSLRKIGGGGLAGGQGDPLLDENKKQTSELFKSNSFLQNISAVIGGGALSQKMDLMPSLEAPAIPSLEAPAMPSFDLSSMGLPALPKIMMPSISSMPGGPLLEENKRQTGLLQKIADGLKSPRITMANDSVMRFSYP